MKRNFTTVLLMAFALLLTGYDSYGTKFTVSVSNFSFSPSAVNATVGDTILWVWSSGNHTTTCNGSSGTSHPAGAASWNSPINSGTPSFEYVLTTAGNYSYVCLPHAPNMAGTINVSSASGIANISNTFNYLEINPPSFKSDAIIKFSLAVSSHITLSIYDFSGRKITMLLNQHFNKGEHTARWDAAGIPQGIYFCRLENEDYTLTRKFVRVK